MFRLVERGVLATALIGFSAGASGGPGWGAAGIETVIATQLDRSAASPLYHVIASAFAAIPVGEPGFRLAVLSGVLGALMLVGVLRATRELLPKDPVAGLVAAGLLALAPPWREAAATAGPAILAACATTWAVVGTLTWARDPGSSVRAAVGALACVAIVVGTAPWLGVALGVLVVIRLRRGPAPLAPLILAAASAALGVVAILLWADALGVLPPLRFELGLAVAATGHGAGAVVVGAGLLGCAFAAITGLAHARLLAAAIGVAAVHTILVDPSPAPLVGLLAIGAAVLPAAIVRAIGAAPERRHLVAALGGAPLLGAALLVGPTLVRVEDPGDAPARLAHDLMTDLPPGPGTFVATRVVPWTAIQHEQRVTGARPDLALAPPGPSDVAIVQALRTGWIAGSDAYAFGRLDPRRARPRGRGFQLVADPPSVRAPTLGPAYYGAGVGAQESVQLALARARYEAITGHLDAAARAAGLEGRFSGSDLAILATTFPSPERPAFFGFVPMLGQPVGSWQLDLFGDDLAWVVGLEVPTVAGPPPRLLHARWRELWSQPDPSDPAITRLGPEAVAATTELWTTMHR